MGSIGLGELVVVAVVAALVLTPVIVAVLVMRRMRGKTVICAACRREHAGFLPTCPHCRYPRSL